MDADAAGNTVVYMVPNYQIDGKTGTWLPYDSEVVEGVCFFMMRNEQRKDTVSPIVVDSKGVFVTDAPNGFENVRAVLAEYVHRAEKKQQDMTEHEKCLTNGTYERARESGTEQNYDMIDGCVNNVPKKPRRIGADGRCWIGCISSKQSGNRKSRLSSNSRSEVVEIKNPL